MSYVTVQSFGSYKRRVIDDYIIPLELDGLGILRYLHRYIIILVVKKNYCPLK